MTSGPTERRKSLKEKYPEIYAQTNINRKDCVRKVPMEILSLGMGRTGTMCKFFALSFLAYLFLSSFFPVPLSLIQRMVFFWW
jgi:hypothetical protein